MARGKAKVATGGLVDGPWALPEGWRWERLSGVVEVHDYLRRPINQTERQTRITGAGQAKLYPYYGATGLVGEIDDFVADGSYVLLGEDGAPFLDPFKNKAYEVSGKFWVNNHAHVLRAGEHLDNRWLLHWLNTFDYRDTVNGTTRLKLTQAAMNDMPVPVPSPDSRHAIVARIDELFAEIDDGEAALARARTDLATWRKALLKAAVTGELTADWRAANPPTETGAALLARILADRRTRWLADPRNKAKRYVEPAAPETTGLPALPEDWVWATAGQVVRQTEYGTSTKCNEVPEGPPVLRMSNIQDGGIDWRKLKYAPVDELLPLLTAGDVLFNRTNSAELLGKSAVFDGADNPVSFASYLVAVRLLSVRPHYFSAWMNSIFGRQWVSENKSQQVGQANLSAGALMRMPLPVPPLAEQDRILEIASLCRIGDDELLTEIVDHQSAATTLRQSILAAAFRGDLAR